MTSWRSIASGCSKMAVAELCCWARWAKERPFRLEEKLQIVRSCVKNRAGTRAGRGFGFGAFHS